MIKTSKPYSSEWLKSTVDLSHLSKKNPKIVDLSHCRLKSYFGDFLKQQNSSIFLCFFVVLAFQIRIFRWIVDLRVYPENWFSNLEFEHKTVSLFDNHQMLPQIVPETFANVSYMLLYYYDTCGMLRESVQLPLSRENEWFLFFGEMYLRMYLYPGTDVPRYQNPDISKIWKSNIKNHEKSKFRLVFGAC